MSVLPWEEIQIRATEFSARWRNCDGEERQQAQTFEKDLMWVFGVDWRDGLHEVRVTHPVTGRRGYIDYLLPGKILIEMKAKGESLIRSYNQALEYSRSLSPEDSPEIILVSDFENMQVTNTRSGDVFNPFKTSQLKKYVRMFGTIAGYDSSTKFET